MILSALKSHVRRRIEHRLCHKPEVTLAVDNLYAYLDALEKTSALSGAIVEIGCAKGHTSAIAATFVARRRDRQRRYICVDTFAGFTRAHIEREKTIRPLEEKLATSFRDIQLEEVRGNFTKWGVSMIETFKADISSFDLAAATNGRISVALVDVDLFQPCYDALHKSYDLLETHGVIIVDDVRHKDWGGADVAYKKFCEEKHIEPQYYCSFGVIEKTKGTTGWPMKASADDDCPYHFDERAPIPSVRL